MARFKRLPVPSSGAVAPDVPDWKRNGCQSMMVRVLAPRGSIAAEFAEAGDEASEGEPSSFCGPCKGRALAGTGTETGTGIGSGTGTGTGIARRWGKDSRSEGRVDLLAAATRERVQVPPGCPNRTTLKTELYVGKTAEEAIRIYWQNGMVIIPDAISIRQADEMLETCFRAEAEMLNIDRDGVGNRGQGRYSFGGAALSGQLFYEPAYAHLINSDAVMSVLDGIWGRGQYCLKGAGGDFVRGHTDEYQALHADISRLPPAFNQEDRIPAMLVVNFVPQEITLVNGPMRILPNTGIPQKGFPPDLDTESDDRKHSFCPLRKGSALIRDPRVWHGGTPNYSDTTRFLPGLELMSRAYVAQQEKEAKGKGKGPGRFAKRTMPRDVWYRLGEYGQTLADGVVSDAPVPRGFKPNFVQPQGKVFAELATNRLRNMLPGGNEQFPGMRPPEKKRLFEIARSMGYEATEFFDGPRKSVVVSRTR